MLISCAMPILHLSRLPLERCKLFAQSLYTDEQGLCRILRLCNCEYKWHPSSDTHNSQSQCQLQCDCNYRHAAYSCSVIATGTLPYVLTCYQALKRKTKRAIQVHTCCSFLLVVKMTNWSSRSRSSDLYPKFGLPMAVRCGCTSPGAVYLHTKHPL